MVIKSENLIGIVLLLVALISGGSAYAHVRLPVEEIPPAGQMSEIEFKTALNDISGCLEQGRAEDVLGSITFDFLWSVKDQTYQDQILPHTRQWIVQYGEEFPEAFLLHCLAGGDMDVVRDQYHSLSNLVSKNCVRWCLMVRDEVLDEKPVKARQGRCFYNDNELWRALPVTQYASNCLSKSFFVTRRCWRSCWWRGLEGGFIVTRDDGVPVPWGAGLVPRAQYMPFEVPYYYIQRSYRGYDQKPSFKFDEKDFGKMGLTDRVYFETREASFSTMVPGNRVWNFFITTYSPFEYLGGQFIARKSSDVIAGTINDTIRVLVSEEKDMPDSLKEFGYQDLVISPSIPFRMYPEGRAPQVEIDFPGEVFPISTPFDFSSDRMREYDQVIKQRKRIQFWLKAAGVISVSVVLIGGLVWIAKRKRSIAGG